MLSSNLTEDEVNELKKSRICWQPAGRPIHYTELVDPKRLPFSNGCR